MGGPVDNPAHAFRQALGYCLLTWLSTGIWKLKKALRIQLIECLSLKLVFIPSTKLIQPHL
jgi:hypothetical protein